MPSKKSDPRQATPSKQRNDRAAVIDNPKRPHMADVTVAPRRIGGKIIIMDADPSPSRAKRNTMSAFPRRIAKASRPVKAGAPLKEQEADPEQVISGNAGRGYLRLRLHVEDGEMEVQSAKFVEGPFNRDRRVTPGLGYEVKIGRRSIAVGDVPDPTEYRSFPDPKGRSGLDHHHVSEARAFDFAVRIAAEDLAEKDLDDLRIDLYRWRGKGPGDHIEAAELSKQPKAAVERLSRMSGLEVDSLPRTVQRSLTLAFKQANES